MKHVMVDLETLSTRHDAAIISIGAVQFDLDEGLLGQDYFMNVIPDERFHVDGRTAMWWMKQSAEARAALQREPITTLDVALKDFAKWFPKGASLWGNGATFDNVILRNAYRVTGIAAPWHYRDDRCFRTMAALLPQAMWPPHGTAHNALDDARAQATYLLAAWAKRRAG